MASPRPASKETPASTKHGHGKIAIQGGGHDRFGAIGGLQVYRDQTVELARFLAEQLGLGPVFEEGDPQVTVTAIRYAMALQAEMNLASGIAKEVAERAENTGKDHGAAFFDATMARAFAVINDDIDRNHKLTRSLRAELRDLAEERRDSPPE